jgi:hypothetical protein
MRRLSRLLPVALLPLLLLLLPARPAPADEEADDLSGFERAPDPGTVAGEDADLFREALGLQQAGRYRAARRLLWRLLDEHPESPFASEARDRSGENAFLGFTRMNAPRPSERRIDVALMGDGYVLDRQDRFDKDAQGHLEVLLREPVYAAYETYFNWWRFNLASKETGVDEVEPPPPDEELEERRQKRKPRRLREYETALDCKAAGPQNQVMANPRRVWHYLSYLDVNDALAICFAQKGVLGMGGMGIATTGPKGVVVHEFGHAFGGLLDEYAVNPGEPAGQVEAANATTRKDDPPWRHFLDARVPGVGVYEGGATFQTGVWRPAASCAMNVGGSAYCPVCREATILTIYTYVSPIDEATPQEAELTATADGFPEVRVVPMAPTAHALDVTFFLGPEPARAETPADEPAPYDPDEDVPMTPLERRLREKLRGEGRMPKPADPPATVPHKPGLVRRWQGTANDPPPPGREIRSTRHREKDGRWAHTPQVPRLAPGRYVLTAVVRDPAKPKGERFPWVLKDERGLLEDRRTWVLVLP